MDKSKGIEYSFGPSRDLTPHDDAGIPKMSNSMPAKTPTIHALGDSAFSSCDPRVSEVPEFKVGSDSVYGNLNQYGLDGDISGPGSGTTSTPPATGDNAADMSDFNRLKVKLAHKKNVTDPAALAAYIGRKKLGKKKFNQRSIAGRVKAQAQGHDDADDILGSVAGTVGNTIGNVASTVEQGSKILTRGAGEAAAEDAMDDYGDPEHVPHVYGAWRHPGQPKTMYSQHFLDYGDKDPDPSEPPPAGNTHSPQGKPYVEIVRGVKPRPVSTTFIRHHPNPRKEKFRSTEVMTAPQNQETRDSAADDSEED